MSCHCESSAAGDMRVSVCGSASARRQRRALVRDQATGDRERGGGAPSATSVFESGCRGVAPLRGRRPPDRDGDRDRLGARVVRDAQLAGHPVALDAVVEAGRDDEEVLGHPRPRDGDALADERLGEVLAGRGHVGQRLHLLGRAGRCRVGRRSRGRAATARATRTRPRRRGRAQQRDPPRPQHDLAECRREDLAPAPARVGRRRHPALYGATTTSTRWNSLRSEYPVVAIDLRSAPMRFAVPSATGAGPYRTASSVVDLVDAHAAPAGQLRVVRLRAPVEAAARAHRSPARARRRA